MKPAVPHGDDELRVRNGERTGEMHGIATPESVLPGKFPGIALDLGRQLDGPDRAPELLPRSLRLPEAVEVQVVVPIGGGERGPDFGVGQPARQGGVAAVPQRNGEGGPRLLDEQLHECAGIEVDEWHSAALLAHEAGYGLARTGPCPTGRGRSSGPGGSGHRAVRRQPFQQWTSGDPQQARHGHASVGHDDLGTASRPRQPLAQVRSQLADGNVHDLIVQQQDAGLYASNGRR